MSSYHKDVNKLINDGAMWASTAVDTDLTEYEIYLLLENLVGLISAERELMKNPIASIDLMVHAFNEHRVFIVPYILPKTIKLYAIYAIGEKVAKNMWSWVKKED